MVQEELIPFGERLRDQDPLHLTIPAARQAAMAVLRNSDFTLRELRSITVGGSDSEILVVDCTCDAVWSQNPAGIRYREPLALRFYADRDRMPEARALRRGFPVLLHTNEVPPQEPAWLCLYFEPWSAIIRTWTAQKFLARLQWWLVQSANGTLHPASQPPEQIYFESPISVVLPPNFDGLDPNTVRTLVLEPRSPQESPRWVLSAQARPTGNARPDLKFAWVTLRLPAIAHDRPERSPTTLGELDDRLRSRGAPVAEELFREIQRIAEGNGLAIVPGQRTLIILTIPTVNPAGGPPRIQRRGLLVEIPIGELGSMAGVLMRMTNPDRYVAVGTIGGLQLAPEWRAVSVHLVELHESFTDESARLYSGIDGPGPSGVLAGLGALGSVVADIWMREGWGRWTYIDPDLLLPHNLARHRGYERQIGVPKVEVIRQLESALYPGRQLPPVHQAKVNDSTNSDVQTSLSQADLIVDVTTTVEVPRDLSARDSSPRAASLFLTPSGRDSALLLEDASRKVRLDVLEAQYYRLVLGAAWGETHLVGHHGNLWVGAGCRDTSTVLSNEFVQLHAAVLARQLRMRSRSPDPVIQVWRMNPDTGTVDTTIAGVIQPLFIDLADMQLVWDEGVRLKIRALRSEGLPNETGGVLLGYFDLVNRRVYVVDALPAPPDSSRERSGFERGTEGLEANVDESKRRTADIVGYIGEWHSHPRNIEARPSNADIKLLLHLAAMLQEDGFPALMLIVGEDDERWLIGNVV